MFSKPHVVLHPSHENLSPGCVSAFWWVVGTLSAVLFVMWLYAVAISTLWGWFVVPIFGLPQLSLAAAYGLHLLVFIFSPNKELGQSNSFRSWAEAVNYFLIQSFYPVFTLAIGWLLHFLV